MEHAALIELLDGEGRVRAIHKVQAWPLTIGRSPDCDFILSDRHLTGAHARLDWSEDGASLTLLDSLNGGWCGERRLHAGDTASLGRGAAFQLGATQLRLRTSAQALPAEVPIDAQDELVRRHAPAGHWALLPALLGVWLGLELVEKWASLDPGSSWLEYSSVVLASVGVVFGWAALWSLITQLFRRRFPFALHLRRILIVSLTLEVLGLVVPLVAYSLSWPALMVVEALSVPVAGTFLLWWQAEAVWPRVRRSLGVFLGVLLLLGLGLMVARRQEQQYWFQPSYLSALPPPAIRLAQPKPAAVLIDDMKSLKAPLDALATKDSAGNPQDDDE